MRELDGKFDFIAVDLPPVTSPLCVATASALDGLLMVVESRKTHQQLAARSAQRLAFANATIYGIIFNKCSGDVPKWLSSAI
jgi:Mrp family chromosome partitioning ATPase